MSYWFTAGLLGAVLFMIAKWDGLDFKFTSVNTVISTLALTCMGPFSLVLGLSAMSSKFSNKK